MQTMKAIRSRPIPDHLQGKEALVRDDPEFPGRVLVQFNDRTLKEAFGWTQFPQHCFLPVA